MRRTVLLCLLTCLLSADPVAAKDEMPKRLPPEVVADAVLKAVDGNDAAAWVLWGLPD